MQWPLLYVQMCEAWRTKSMSSYIPAKTKWHSNIWGKIHTRYNIFIAEGTPLNLKAESPRRYSLFHIPRQSSRHNSGRQLTQAIWACDHQKTPRLYWWHHEFIPTSSNYDNVAIKEIYLYYLDYLKGGWSIHAYCIYWKVEIEDLSKRKSFKYKLLLIFNYI